MSVTSGSVAIDAPATKPSWTLPSARVTWPRQREGDAPARMAGTAAEGTDHDSTSIRAPEDGVRTRAGSGVSPPDLSNR